MSDLNDWDATDPAGAWQHRAEIAEARILELEAFLNLCYEEKMVPTSDDLDALKVPVKFSDSYLARCI